MPTIHLLRWRRGLLRRVLPAVVALGVLTVHATGIADPNTVARHPDSLPVASRPTGVPVNYVLTHNGFFHPSCVVAVQPDETMGQDLVIRGPDGVERERLGACLYERFDRSGTVVVRPHAFDGWIVWYDFAGNIPATSTLKLSTDWLVPLAPTKVVSQDIAFFNGVETSAGGLDILQPVLDFGEVRNRWSMLSEHCCLSGNDVQTTPVAVNPGDVVRGIVEGTGCNSSGACASWVITAMDLTTGKSTVLNTTAPGGVPIEINPGVLETYDITSCDMLPANGQATFYNHSLVDANEQEVPLRYTFRTFATAPAEFPKNCGYRGTAVGDSYTLIFGNMPSEIDGGLIDSRVASVPDASGAGDRDGSSRDASGAGDDPATSLGARGDSRGDDAAGLGGSGVSSGSGGGASSVGGAGLSGSGGSTVGAAGSMANANMAAGAAGGALAPGATTAVAASEGCSCRSVAGRSSAWGAAAVWLLAGVGIARRRRASEPRS